MFLQHYFTPAHDCVCRAKLVAPYTFSPGEETLQTTFFLPNEIPFDQVSW